MGLNPDFWRGKTVLLTGHTGFKGGWLALWLQQLGARVVGYALEPPTDPSFFAQAAVADGMVDVRADIRDPAALRETMEAHRPQVVFHLAAQSLVRVGYREPALTYDTNVMGTLHLMEAMRAVDSVRAAVIVTTDKCYENREQPGYAYVESDPLGGHDPYSASKACAELVVQSSRLSFFGPASGVGIATARAGNVIGGGDWAEDRLVPDMIRGLLAGESVAIRHPGAIRPWQHVLEPLLGYLLLGQALWEDAPGKSGAWNFGPDRADARAVGWIAEYLVAQGAGSWHADGADHPHEATYLALDAGKARADLGWTPHWSLETALDNILAWHRAQAEGEDMQALSLSQIDKYSAAAGVS